MTAHDTDDVRQSACRQSVAKLCRVAVARVCEDDVSAHAGGKRVVDERERDLPLLRKLDLDRNADAASPRHVVGPRFGQEQSHPDARAAELASEMNTDGDLAIIDAPQGARVLACDADGVFALLRKACVVDDQGFDGGKLTIDLAGQSHAALADPVEDRP